MKTLPIATFNTLPAAQRLQKRLEQAGYDAVIHDESRLERFWFLSKPLAAFHVEVKDEQLLSARDWINKLDTSENILGEAVRCPSCGSSDVVFPQITRKFFMPFFEAVAMALHLLPRRFYCQDCQYTWPRKNRKRRKLDILGWPLDSKFWHPENSKEQRRIIRKEHDH